MASQYQRKVLQDCGRKTSFLWASTFFSVEQFSGWEEQVQKENSSWLLFHTVMNDMIKKCILVHQNMAKFEYFPI